MLLNPTTLANWLSPHSIEWYKQLSNLQGKYTYSWNSTITEPNGESIFDKEVVQNILDKKVLDVGCGHGEFTLECSPFAKEIVGFDVTDNFVKIGRENKRKNVTFVLGNTKSGLPFEPNEFDFAYNRKGPTSAYPSLKKVVKKGGKLLGLHPGDELGKELPLLFPELFETLQGSPILDTIYQRLDLSNFSHKEVEVVNSIELLHTPLDVIKLRCFGQDPKIYEALIEENLSEISKIFERNTTKEGLPITFSRYIVRAIV
ncbi:class I SAM-dependent methyltransferase [Bacillus suaedae]|uniref:class I SAM-dependent methyltransferase n=1 Tax=Halalkalibacter suaedae TaxID=2822140 RepID=UPI00321196E1